MPVHMFISLGNILASQFKEENEKQKEEEKKSMAGMPNLSSLSNISSMIGDMSSNFSAPNVQMPSIPTF